MKYLRELRQARGLTQQNIADYLEITRQAYSNYENGNRTPDNETLLKLGEFFEVTVDHLLRGSEQPYHAPPHGHFSVQDIKQALFGNDLNVTDDMYEEVLNYVDFLKYREANKRKRLTECKSDT